jgi:hypothetical protein
MKYADKALREIQNDGALFAKALSLFNPAGLLAYSYRGPSHSA